VRRAGRIARLGPILLFALACEARQDVQAPATPSEKAPATPIVEKLPLPLPSTAACHAQGPNGREIASNAELPADTLLILGPEDACALNHPAGALLKLLGPARVLAAPESAPAVLVQEGILSLDLAPGALSPRSGFWLATPAARLELVQGARLALRVYPGGPSELLVISGVVRVEPAGEGEAARTIAAGHGLSLSASGRAESLEAPGGTLEHAVTWLVARENRAQQGDDARKQLQTRLEAMVERVSAMRAEMRDLARRHEALAAQHEPGLMELQAELARRSGEVLHQQRDLRARAAAFACFWLGEPGASVPAVLGRARELMP
jgi:hypothetical protein